MAPPDNVETPPPPPPPAPADDTSAPRSKGSGGGALSARGGADRRRARKWDQQQYSPQKSPDVEWLLREFKTAPCPHEEAGIQHNQRCCPFYHSDRDRRRLLYNGLAGPMYYSEPCSNMFDNQRGCPYGDMCTFAHNTAELLYHPDAFRRRLCQQARRCPRSRFCFFAHNRDELLTPYFNVQEEQRPTEELIVYRFKTLWCPLAGPHEWENCVYAHTYRDWRRVPFLGYVSHPCPRWSKSLTSGGPEMTYLERCPLGMSCPMAHGAKEQFYHPLFYKTCPCSDAKCKRGPLCAFSHGEQDRRPKSEEEAWNQPMGAQRFPREPIFQAEEILRQCQPMCISPPTYHAFEDVQNGDRATEDVVVRAGKNGRGKGAKSRGGAQHNPVAPRYAPAPSFTEPRFPAAPRQLEEPRYVVPAAASSEDPRTPEKPVESNGSTTASEGASFMTLSGGRDSDAGAALVAAR